MISFFPACRTGRTVGVSRNGLWLGVVNSGKIVVRSRNLNFTMRSLNEPGLRTRRHPRDKLEDGDLSAVSVPITGPSSTQLLQVCLESESISTGFQVVCLISISSLGGFREKGAQRGDSVSFLGDDFGLGKLTLQLAYSQLQPII